MRVFILSLALVLSLLVCKTYAFTNSAAKTIYPVSSLKIHKTKKTVYGIYAGNEFWAFVKKPKITKLTKTMQKKTIYPSVPYHVKLFMRFGNAR